jgi:hypothetical protein
MYMLDPWKNLYVARTKAMNLTAQFPRRTWLRRFLAPIEQRVGFVRWESGDLAMMLEREKWAPPPTFY